MSITFVVRTPYTVPNGRYVKRFRDATVLSWLQRIWHSKHTALELLGGDFYGGFGHLLDARIDESLDAPQTNKQVVELLRNHSYTTHVRTQSGSFEIETDDDEMYLCQYFLDSSFAKKNQNRVEYLMHRKWLPSRVELHPGSKPTTYVAARYPCQSADSIYWDFFKIPGSRLESIGEIVDAMKKPKGLTDCAALIEFLEDVDLNTSWKNVIQRLSTSKSFANKLTQTKCTTHVCELNHHVATWPKFNGERPVFSHLVVYDDLWAKSYPVLVRSLKRMRHGDVLFGKQPANTMH